MLWWHKLDVDCSYCGKTRRLTETDLNIVVQGMRLENSRGESALITPTVPIRQDSFFAPRVVEIISDTKIRWYCTFCGQENTAKEGARKTFVRRFREFVLPSRDETNGKLLG